MSVCPEVDQQRRTGVRKCVGVSGVRRSAVGKAEAGRTTVVSVRRYGSSECGRGRTRAVTARSVQCHCAFVLEERNGGEGGVGEG